MLSLNDLWAKHNSQFGQSYDYSRFHEVSDFQNYETDWLISNSGPDNFINTFAANLIAQYDAAVILASMLAWESASVSSHVYKQRVAIHAASILAAVAFHNAKGLDSGGSIAMVFTMKVVIQNTPSNHQREQAKANLKSWGASRGLQSVTNVPLSDDGIIYNTVHEMEMMKMHESSFEN